MCNAKAWTESCDHLTNNGVWTATLAAYQYSCWESNLQPRVPGYTGVTIHSYETALCCRGTETTVTGRYRSRLLLFWPGLKRTTFYEKYVGCLSRNPWISAETGSRRGYPAGKQLGDRFNVSYGHLQKFFPGGQRRHFADPFQVAGDAMQMDVNKTLSTFYTTKKFPYAAVTNCGLLTHQCFSSNGIKHRGWPL